MWLLHCRALISNMSDSLSFPHSPYLIQLCCPYGAGDDAAYVLAVESVPSLSSVVKRAQLWHWMYAKVRTVCMSIQTIIAD